MLVRRFWATIPDVDTTHEPTPERFQLGSAAAEAYEAQFVPALFAQWVAPLLDLAGVRAGQRVLDVACGTGVVARAAADRTGREADVIGVDLNEAMLAVARRIRPGIGWQASDVTDLPFPGGTFDAVLCQMALMFFPDRHAAMAEIARVVAPGGVAAIAVPASLDDQEAFAPFVELASAQAGPAAAALLSTYFTCGDLDELTRLASAAGLHDVASRTITGRYRFGSIDAAVTTEVESTPLIDRIDTQVYQRIRDGARELWQPFVTPTGALDAPFTAHLVVGRKPR